MLILEQEKKKAWYIFRRRFIYLNTWKYIQLLYFAQLILCSAFRWLIKESKKPSYGESGSSKQHTKVCKVLASVTHLTVVKLLSWVNRCVFGSIRKYITCTYGHIMEAGGTMPCFISGGRVECMPMFLLSLGVNYKIYFLVPDTI